MSTLGCALIPVGNQPSIATSVAATVQHIASPAVPSPPSPANTGKVSGRICYPSEAIPAMTAYFRDTSSGEIVSIAIAPGQSRYDVSLPEGEYHAYAWVWLPDVQIGGAYSQAVACGLEAACGDHNLLPFAVTATSPSSGIDICDWYGGPDSVPWPPGAEPTTPAAGLTQVPGGISLNCDGSQQRVRVEDAGPAGRTVAVDAWISGAWANVWSVSGGEPMIQQIEDGAGTYPFGECRRLIIVPIRYAGSGADLRLEIFAWDGVGVRQVYSRHGTKGAWAKIGDTIRFEEAKFLFGEPNCCPCAMQTTEHTWNGSAFVESRSAEEPTYTGTPPEECRP